MLAPFLVCNGLEVRLQRCAETAATVVKLRGHLDETNAGRFGTFLGDLIADARHSHLRLDFGDIWHVKPSGLRPIVEAHRTHRGRISMGEPPPTSRPIARRFYEMHFA